MCVHTRAPFSPALTRPATPVAPPPPPLAVLVGPLPARPQQAEGVGRAQYVGVDLSPEMTRVAARAHPGARFVTADWLTFTAEGPTTAAAAAETSPTSSSGGSAAAAGGQELTSSAVAAATEASAAAASAAAAGGHESMAAGGRESTAAAEAPCFDAVLFCMALHDLPDPAAALGRAARLVRPGGRVVVAHPKGAAHVAMQHSQVGVVCRGVMGGLDDWRA